MAKIQKSWINEILMKRKAQVSTCIIVETNDPRRIGELFRFLKESEIEYIGDHRLIHYDAWEGLRDLRTNTPIEEKEGIMQALSGSSVMSLSQALRKADVMLKTEKTIFILTGIIEPDPALTLALNNWCHHQALFNTTNKSTAIIIVSDASIFPQETLEKIPVITPPISTQNERRDLLVRIADSLSKKHNLKIEIKPELITTTSGLNLHETETVALESIFRYKSIKLEAVTSLKKEIVERSGILEIYQPEYGFDAIGGYSSIKNFVRDSIIKILRMPERAKQFSVSMPRGALFFGPPGTGKTLFAKAIANETKLPFILLKTENIFSSFVGSSERKMKSAIKIIEECAPAIVFMDEIDRLGTRSDISTDSGTSRRVFSQMLEYLGDENRKALVIGTTNTIEHLDEAFIRAGRFDRLIPVLYPDERARREIFNVHINVKRKVPIASLNLEELVDKTKTYTGAEIEELVKRAALIAFNDEVSKVTQDHFREAMSGFKIDIGERLKQMKKFLSQAEKYCNDQNFLEKLKKEEKIDRIDALELE